MKRLRRNGFITKVWNKNVLLIGVIGVILVVICISGYLLSRDIRAEGTSYIKVGGFEVEYVPGESALTLQDFEQLELGMSEPEVEVILGEADGWIGCGDLWPVYILQDGTAVECLYNGPERGLNIVRWTDGIYSKVIKTSENMVRQVDLILKGTVEAGDEKQFGYSRYFMERTTWWWQMDIQEEYDSFAEMNGLVATDIQFDFDNNNYILTYGRPLKEFYYDMSYEYGYWPYTTAVYDGAVPYTPCKVYIYQMEEISFEDPEWGWGGLEIADSDVCYIQIDGYTAEYYPRETKLSLENFEALELGISCDEIKEKLGEPYDWIGEELELCALPVFILEDGTAVVCYFNEEYDKEDLLKIKWFDGQGNSKVIKSKVE